MCCRVVMYVLLLNWVVLGDKSVMDIPYSEMSMTAKAVETYGDPSQPLANVLMNNPSIRTSTTSPMYTDFSMRGINMNGNHMMLNGVPSLFYQFTTPPSHVIDRIDIMNSFPEICSNYDDLFCFA